MKLLMLAALLFASSDAKRVASGYKPIKTKNQGPDFPAMPSSYTMDLSISIGDTGSSRWGNLTYSYTSAHSEAGVNGEKETNYRMSRGSYFRKMPRPDRRTRSPPKPAAKPTFTKKDKTAALKINFPSSLTAFAGFPKTMTDNYFIKFTGMFVVKTDAMFAMWLTSDDGSILYWRKPPIRGRRQRTRLLISHDGSHAMSTKNATLALAKGSHEMTLLYYEGRGDAGLILQYAFDAAPKALIKPDANRVDFDGSKFYGDGLSVGVWDLNVAPKLTISATVYNFDALMKFSLTDSNDDGLLDNRDKCVGTSEEGAAATRDRDWARHAGTTSATMRPPGGFFCRRSCNMDGPIYYRGTTTVRGIRAEKWEQQFTTGANSGWQKNRRAAGHSDRSPKYEFFFAAEGWNIPGNTKDTRTPLRVIHYRETKFDPKAAAPRPASKGNMYVYWINTKLKRCGQSTIPQNWLPFAQKVQAGLKGGSCFSVGYVSPVSPYRGTSSWKADLMKGSGSSVTTSSVSFYEQKAASLTSRVDSYDVTNFVFWPRGLPDSLFDPTSQGWGCTGLPSKKAVSMGMTLSGDGGARRTGTSKKVIGLPPIPTDYSMEMEVSQSYRGGSTRLLQEFHSQSGTKGEREEVVREDRDEMRTIPSTRSLGKPDVTLDNITSLDYSCNRDGDTAHRDVPADGGKDGCGGIMPGLTVQPIRGHPNPFLDSYVSQYRGKLTVGQKANYMFELCSTDGSKLYIQTDAARGSSVRTVVDNDGTFGDGMRCKTGYVLLGPKVGSAGQLQATGLEFYLSHMAHRGRHGVRLSWWQLQDPAKGKQPSKPVVGAAGKKTVVTADNFESKTIVANFWFHPDLSYTKRTVTMWNYDLNMKFVLNDANRDGSIDPANDDCVATAEDLTQDADYRAHSDGVGSVRPPGGFFCVDRPGEDVCGKSSFFYTGTGKVRGIDADLYTQVFNKPIWNGIGTRDLGRVDTTKLPTKPDWVWPTTKAPQAAGATDGIAALNFYTPRTTGSKREVAWPGLPTKLDNGVSDPFLDYWVAGFGGKLLVPKAGNYTFWMAATDNGYLYIDNKRVMDDRTDAGWGKMVPPTAIAANIVRVFYINPGTSRYRSPTCGESVMLKSWLPYAQAHDKKAKKGEPKWGQVGSCWDQGYRGPAGDGQATWGYRERPPTREMSVKVNFFKKHGSFKTVALKAGQVDFRVDFSASRGDQGLQVSWAAGNAAGLKTTDYSYLGKVNFAGSALNAKFWDRSRGYWRVAHHEYAFARVGWRIPGAPNNDRARTPLRVRHFNVIQSKGSKGTLKDSDATITTSYTNYDMISFRAYPNGLPGGTFYPPAQGFKCRGFLSMTALRKGYSLTSGLGTPVAALPPVATTYKMELEHSSYWRNSSQTLVEYHDDGTAGEKESTYATRSDRQISDIPWATAPTMTFKCAAGADKCAGPGKATLSSTINYADVDSKRPASSPHNRPWVGLESAAGKNLYKDTFAVRITGTLSVPAAGSYTFWLGSDDGSLLFVDGKQRIDNDGQHAASPMKNATLTLTKGAHSLEMKYFENGGWSSMQLQMSGPGRALSDVSKTDMSGMRIDVWDRSASKREMLTATVFNYEANQKFVITDSNFDGDITPADTCIATAQDIKADRDFRGHSDGVGNVRPADGFLCNARGDGRSSCPASQVYYNGLERVRGIWSEKYTQAYWNGTGTRKWGGRGTTRWALAYKEYFFASTNWRIAGNKAKSRVPVRIRMYYEVQRGGKNGVWNSPSEWIWDNYDVVNFHALKQLSQNVFDPTSQGFLCTGTLSVQAEKMVPKMQLGQRRLMDGSNSNMIMGGYSAITMVALMVGSSIATIGIPWAVERFIVGNDAIGVRDKLDEGDGDELMERDSL